MNYQISLFNMQNGSKITDPSQCNFTFSFSAPSAPEQSELNIYGNFQVEGDDLGQISLFACFTAVIALFKLYGMYRLLNYIMLHPMESTKISILFVGLCTIWDTYYFIKFLYFALQQQQLYIMFVPTILYAFLFVYNIRCVILLWDPRYSHTFQNNREQRLGLLKYISKLYILLFAGIALLYLLEIFDTTYLCMSIYLIPQIIHSTMKGQALKFNKPIIIFLVCYYYIRLAFMLYLRGCPDNIYLYTPQKTFCILIVLELTLQLLFIYLQNIFGARFFIRCLLPKPFNYFVDYQYDIENLPTEDICPICMCHLYEDPDDIKQPLIENFNDQLVIATDQQQQNQEIQQKVDSAKAKKKMKKVKIMLTPCKHKYHTKCLKRWMEIKLECPFCKAELPSLE